MTPRKFYKKALKILLIGKILKLDPETVMFQIRDLYGDYEDENTLQNEKT